MFSLLFQEYQAATLIKGLETNPVLKVDWGFLQGPG